jgi:hypothetical protein
MTDLLEEKMRDTLRERAAQIDPAAITRLRAIDYRPRQRRFPRPAVGALGVSATAAGVVAAVTLSAGAAPAFAGWSATPTRPATGQLAAAEQACSSGLGTPALTDTRGPYTAAIYEDGTTGSRLCLQGDSLSIATSEASEQAGIAAGQIQLSGLGMQDSSGNAWTLVDGRIGTGVTAVTIDLRDGSSIQATVSGGWYLAWWPGTTGPSTADVTSTTGTATDQFPSTPNGPAPSNCPAGAHCASGYSFGAGHAGSSGGTVVKFGPGTPGAATTGTGTSGSATTGSQ